MKATPTARSSMAKAPRSQPLCRRPSGAFQSICWPGWVLRAAARSIIAAVGARRNAEKPAEKPTDQSHLQANLSQAWLGFRRPAIAGAGINTFALPNGTVVANVRIYGGSNAWCYQVGIDCKWSQQLPGAPSMHIRSTFSSPPSHRSPITTPWTSLVKPAAPSGLLVPKTPRGFRHQAPRTRAASCNSFCRRCAATPLPARRPPRPRLLHLCRLHHRRRARHGLLPGRRRPYRASAGARC
jgi:hypothetical protein